jgi:hypothetical protein
MREMKEKMVMCLKKFAANPKAVMASKFLATVFVTVCAWVSYAGVAFAAGDTSQGADFSGVVSPIEGLINSLVNPLLILVGAGGTIFCIFLGVKFATAEEPQEKEKRKQALKTAIIGFFLIFVLIVALRLSIKPLSEWMQKSSPSGGSAPTTQTTTTP